MCVRQRYVAVEQDSYRDQSEIESPPGGSSRFKPLGRAAV